MHLPRWMRMAMLATAAMNLLGAGALLPAGERVRSLVGLPPDVHPVYLLTIASFVVVFGAAYAWCGLTGRADGQFLAVAAAGKLSFVVVLMAFWLTGDLPITAPLAGIGDLVFGGLFLIWLLRSWRSRSGSDASTLPVTG
ncbi:MAG: hypothetical protein H0U69_15985 [Trueperaceae bacterium]|nr:hypothetical protein [Trueperaceae bacterium]